MKKASMIMILSLGAILSLASCGQTGSSSKAASSQATSSSSSQAGSSASSEATSSSAAESSSSEAASSSVASTKFLTLTLQKNTMKAGTDFFEGCVPTVVYTNKTTVTDMTEYWNFLSWEIVDGAGTSYAVSQILPEGSYTVQVTYVSKSLKSSTLSFTATAGETVAASEGKGYKTVTSDAVSANTIGHFDNVGALGTGKFQTTGVRKLLVVPVTFTDAAEFSAENLATIQSAYFGDATSTGWQSLASYYKTSSYGKLNITGTVTSQYIYPSTSADFESQGTGGVASVVNGAVAFATSLGYNMADYDTDGDGYVDGVELVYKTNRADKSSGGKDVWWNFTSVTGNTANTSSPVGYRYFWSLFKYISNGYYTPDIDCHTLIHESGHMMGLNDYYSYNNDEGPAGCVDMMDMNVGDHNAYSKYMFGWVAPKVVDGSASDFTITLNSFTDTGDCLLVRNTTTDPWNGTPYDEYLMLQYYTPTGLNEKDSTGYPEWKNARSSGSTTSAYGHAGTYAKAGLQVFHVDNRLAAQTGTYDTATNKILTSKYSYIDSPSNTMTKNTDGTYVGASSQISSNSLKYAKFIDESGKLVVSSTATTDERSKIRELTAMPAGGSTSYLGSSYYASMGSQETLYGTSDYGESNADYTNIIMRQLMPKGTTFNDGSTFNWCFQVTAQTDSTVTLHFVEL
jgi:M6 family metalloprotease-like protein